MSSFSDKVSQAKVCILSYIPQAMNQSERIILENAANAVQQCLIRQAQEEFDQEAPTVSAWVLSGSQDRQLVVTSQTIGQPLSLQETTRILDGHRHLMFCSKHCFVPPNDFHLIRVEDHSAGDYTVIPEGNNPFIDRVLIRMPEHRGETHILISRLF